MSSYLDKTGLTHLWEKIKAKIPTKTSDLTNDSGYLTSPNIPYLTCSTAAGTTAKTTTLVSGKFTESDLVAGAQVLVDFTNTNTVANPTLSVNGTTAKAIRRYGTTAPSTSAASSWNAGSIVLFVYDGTYWTIENWLNSTYSAMSVAEMEAGTSSTARLITAARLKAAVEKWKTNITGGATTIVSDDLDASRALISDGNGKVAVSLVTSTELGYLDGVTSNIQTQLTEVKTSVSNGKSAIASAITDKGVSTSSSDSFTTMASNIDKLKVANLVPSVGTWHGTEYSSFPTALGSDSGNTVTNQNICVYNDELYVVSSRSSTASYRQYFQKFNGSSWTNLTSVPSDIRRYSCCCVYNGKIHVIAPTSDLTIYHYTTDGSAWTNIGTESISYSTSYSASSSLNIIELFVYKNELYAALTAVYNSNTIIVFAKWTGSGWIAPGGLASNTFFTSSRAVGVVVNDDYLFTAMCDNSYRRLYRYNGTAWTNLGDIGAGLRGGAYSPSSSIVEYHGYVYVFGQAVSTSINYGESNVDGDMNYDVFGNTMFDGESIRHILGFPFTDGRGHCSFVFNDKLYVMLCSRPSSTNYRFWLMFEQNYIDS